ncbi:DUF2807 domain-containing protein [Robiginitalea sp. M366]|uniref:GIN domain-containing protein n=1 Tax=Robiginitalea aestuariiviva TaxID=3036903 RepID=UPI00240DA127|nr:DUF2807 domain-containing protein [Robiginitalea aestuariiviva]MDG1571018.1 DUF2807 domain-containing protein [Robiginitalea aestuariiviva]
MKRIWQMTCGLALLFILAPAQANAQRKPKIKGSRVPVEVRQDLPGFHTLRLADPLEVEVRMGAAPGYLLEVDDNLVDVLRLEVRDSVLQVSSFYNITASKALKIVVYANQLNAVEALDGEVFSENPVTTDLLTVVARGGARVNLRARAAWFDLFMEDSSRADLNVEADSVSLRLGARADAVLYTVTDGLSATLAQNAGLTLEGLSVFSRVEGGDNTSLKAARLHSDQLELRLAGSATARVQARQETLLDLSGQTRTYLYGQPAIQLQRFTDRAELHKEPE